MYHPPRFQRKKPHRDGQCDPQYKFWRLRVLARDKSRCLSCGRKGRIRVCPVLPIMGNPAVAYDESNGLCLCKQCRDDIPDEVWIETVRMLILQSKCEENNG